jgi:hypothetical protein
MEAAYPIHHCERSAGIGAAILNSIDEHIDPEAV